LLDAALRLDDDGLVATRTQDTTVAPDQATASPTIQPSTGDQAPGGLTATTRIMNDQGAAPAPQIDQKVLGDLIGDNAARQVTSADVPPEATQAAHDVLKVLQDPEALKAAATANNSLIDQMILDRASAMMSSPKGQALIAKLRSFSDAQPGVIFESLILAITSAFGGAELPELHKSHPLDGATTFTASTSVEALHALIQRKQAHYTAAAGISHDIHQHVSTGFARVTFEDLAHLHKAIDHALVEYHHVETAGHGATDQIMAQIAVHLRNVGFQLEERTTWGPIDPQGRDFLPDDASAGAIGSGPRQLHESVTERVALPSWRDYKLTLDATQRFSSGHEQNSVGGSLQLPRVHDVGLTVGAEVPLGEGTLKPAFKMEIDFKGVTLSIRQSAAHEAQPRTVEYGPASTSIKGWTVGIKKSFGG
jgi:hypothetical protein